MNEHLLIQPIRGHFQRSLTVGGDPDPFSVLLDFADIVRESYSTLGQSKPT